MTKELLPVAITAAQLGGEVLRRHFRRLDPDEVSEKERNDWVSVADLESEREIRDYLERRAVGIGVLAEESGASGSQGLRWVIDPLDGTANYVRGFPHFAVSVALAEGDHVVLGAVHDPMRLETFYARRGAGAFRDGAPLRVSSRPGLAGGMVATGFPFRIRRHLDVYLRLFREVFLRTGSIRRPGAAALDLVHTAAGIFDGFFELGLSPWDVAAGRVIVEEAGGKVSNLDGGADVFTRGNIVAAGAAVHREIVEIAGGVCRDEAITG